MVAVSLRANYYYLSYNGSDSNDGLKRYEPFQTFSKAASEMSPGDYLICDGFGGIYFIDSTACSFTLSGNSDSLIHILGINGFNIANASDSVTYFDLSSSNYLVVNNLQFNSLTYNDSLYVRLGYSTSGIEKYYYLNNCFFETKVCITDTFSEGDYFANLFITACCFIDGLDYSVKVYNDLSNNYSTLSINHCSFYSTEPIYINNTGGTAYNFSLQNTIIHTCTNIITLAEGTLDSPTHKQNILYGYDTYCDLVEIVPNDSEMEADPLYNSTTFHNLYLQELSPAIGFYSSYCGALPRIALKIGDL